MWNIAEDPIKQRMRQIAAWLRSTGQPVGPKLIEICDATPALADYKIEAAEVAAGEKHLYFQRCFEQAPTRTACARTSSPPSAPIAPPRPSPPAGSASPNT